MGSARIYRWGCWRADRLVHLGAQHGPSGLRCVLRSHRNVKREVRAGWHIEQVRTRPGRHILHRMAIATCDGPSGGGRTWPIVPTLTSRARPPHNGGADRRQPQRARRSHGPQYRRHLGSPIPDRPNGRHRPIWQMCLAPRTRSIRARATRRTAFLLENSSSSPPPRRQEPERHCRRRSMRQRSEEMFSKSRHVSLLFLFSESGRGLQSCFRLSSMMSAPTSTLTSETPTGTAAFCVLSTGRMRAHREAWALGACGTQPLAAHAVRDPREA